MKSPHEKKFQKLPIRKTDPAQKHEQSFQRSGWVPSSLRACSAITLFKVLHVTLQLCQYAIDQGWRYRLVYVPREVNIFEIPSDPHQRKKFFTLTSECKKLPNTPEDDGCPSEIRPFPPRATPPAPGGLYGFSMGSSPFNSGSEPRMLLLKNKGGRAESQDKQQSWPHLLFPRAFHLGSHEVPETAYEKQTLRFYYS